jgi:hypothetical protein
MAVTIQLYAKKRKRDKEKLLAQASQVKDDEITGQLPV